MISTITVEDLLEIAAKKYGSEDLVRTMLPRAASKAELSAIPDDRYLSAASKCIFQAGFVWRVIEAKWSEFEETFNGFNPLGMASMSDERIEELMQDKRIVRNRQKILTIRDNGLMMTEIASEHGSFAQLIANWPSSNIIELWSLLKRRGSRLGGMSGPRLLRAVNKDTFILTEEVGRALVNHNLIGTIPTNSKKSMQAAQSVFNQLSDTSGWSLCQISKLLALTNQT